MKNAIVFQFSPGNETESADKFPNEKNRAEYNPQVEENTKSTKSFFQKLKEALRDWSNKDERDRQYDDTHV